MDFFDTRYFRINKLFLSFVGLWPYQTSRMKILTLSFAIFGVTIMCVPQVTLYMIITWSPKAIKKTRWKKDEIHWMLKCLNDNCTPFCVEAFRVLAKYKMQNVISIVNWLFIVRLYICSNIWTIWIKYSNSCRPQQAQWYAWWRSSASFAIPIR